MLAHWISQEAMVWMLLLQNLHTQSQQFLPLPELFQDRQRSTEEDSKPCFWGELAKSAQRMLFFLNPAFLSCNNLGEIYLLFSSMTSHLKMTSPGADEAVPHCRCLHCRVSHPPPHALQTDSHEDSQTFSNYFKELEPFTLLCVSFHLIILLSTPCSKAWRHPGYFPCVWKKTSVKIISKEGGTGGKCLCVKTL